MSGGAIAAAVVSAGIGLYTANRQEKAQDRANRLQREAQEKARLQQTQQMRQQNQQQADVSGLLEGNTASDMSSTMLTGAGGVNPGSLSLGRGNSLLGG